MKCPKCNNRMIGYEFDIANNDIPLVIDVNFFVCSNCLISCFDIDRSKFEYYLLNEKIKENKAIFQAKVDSGYYDWS